MPDEYPEPPHQNHRASQLLFISIPRVIERSKSTMKRFFQFLLLAATFLIASGAAQATNIAEEVLFILEGRSAKHPYLQHGAAE